MKQTIARRKTILDLVQADKRFEKKGRAVL